MDSGGKIPTTEIKAQLLRDVDEGRISTNAAELINACSALLQMSGKNEHSGGVGEHDTSSTVHGQQTNHATLLKGNAFSHADTASAGAVTKDLNSVSPEEPNFVSCQKPLHADISTTEAGEKSVRRPLLPTRSRQPMEMRLCAKDTLWMQNYRELQAFKAEYGHTNVPQLYKNVSLGNWVKYNRHKMREWDNSCCSHEDKEKMKLLIEIGLAPWVGKGNAPKVNGVTLSQRQIQTWEAQFTSLCEYKEEYGDCDVPTNEIGRWRTLGEWVKRQRKVYRNFHSAQEAQNNPTNRYLLERFDRLRKVGFKFRIGSGSGSGRVRKKLAGGNHLINVSKHRGNSVASLNNVGGSLNNLTDESKEGNSKKQAQVEVTNHHQRPPVVSLATGPTTVTTVQQTSAQQTSGSTSSESKNRHMEKAGSSELKKLAGGNHLMNVSKYSGNSIASLNNVGGGLINLTDESKEGNSKQQAQVEVTNHHQRPPVVSLATGPTTMTTVQQTSAQQTSGSTSSESKNRRPATTTTVQQT